MKDRALSQVECYLGQAVRIRVRVWNRGVSSMTSPFFSFRLFASCVIVGVLAFHASHASHASPLSTWQIDHVQGVYKPLIAV